LIARRRIFVKMQALTTGDCAETSAEDGADPYQYIKDNGYGC